MSKPSDRVRELANGRHDLQDAILAYLDEQAVATYEAQLLMAADSPYFSEQPPTPFPPLICAEHGARVPAEECETCKLIVASLRGPAGAMGGEPTKCWCLDCFPEPIIGGVMRLCSLCGNKRCPHAVNHRNVCTRSNELNQPEFTWVSHTDALVAQLSQAREALAREEREHIETIGRRDELEEKLEDFARQMGEEAGEHSNCNDPWANALEEFGRLQLVEEQLKVKLAARCDHHAAIHELNRELATVTAERDRLKHVRIIERALAWWAGWDIGYAFASYTFVNSRDDVPGLRREANPHLPIKFVP